VKVSLHVIGNYQHTGPKTIPQGARYLTVKRSLDNSYSSEYVVAAEDTLTGLQQTNPLDPASQQEMNDYAAKVKAREDRIYHSADNLRGKGPGAPAGMRMNPMAMMNPQMMQKIMACGQDQACKQTVAMEMMAQQQAQASGPGAQVMGDVQAISDMCVKKGNKLGSKGHEACMNAEGEKRSTVKSTAADNEPEVAELPGRYFLYRNGVNACQFKAHARISESGAFGSISDGEGGGQYGEGSGGVQAEGDFDPKDFQPCSNAQAAFDTKTNLFWGGALLPAHVEPQYTGMGVAVMGDGGVIPAEINAWIASTMQGAPASGTKTQKFGYQTATLTWSFAKE
jgi:hypothetical protein